MPDDPALTLARSLRALGAVVERDPGGCAFRLRGVAGRIALGEADDPRGTLHTHGRVTLAPGAPPLALELRPHTAEEQRWLDRGEAFDLELGDAEFDRAFVLEAAPAETARALFDGPMRAALVALAPCRFALDAGDLHLSKAGSHVEAGVVELMVTVCVGVRERVQRLALDDARRGEPAGYRDAASTPSRPEDEARALAEIETVEELRRTRRQGPGAKVGLVLLGVLVAGVLLEWMAHR